ncbi:MAG TPA: NTP transferase domain-containing protein [Patescibacteria group bacterium]|nr:NTP transferase domain-containing protein [Patescibacteria group bacterium]
MRKIENIIILAGGKSTRFWPLADKNTFMFCGKPLIVHQAEKFLPLTHHLWIVTGQHNKDKISHLVASYKNVKIVTQKHEGQASALLAVSSLRGEVLVVNNGDIFDEQVIFDAIFARRNRAKLILATKEMDAYFPGGYLVVKGDIVTSIIEKPNPDKLPSSMVRLVADYFSHFDEFVSILQKHTGSAKDGAYEDCLNSYIAQNGGIYTKYSGYWHFLKYPWHVLDVQSFFLSQLKSYRGKNVLIDKTATVEGNVYFEDGVSIYEYAKVSGPAYIGKNTVVGNYSLVRESSVGQGSMIGSSSEVARSYCGENVWLHRNYVGDSVIDGNVLFGAEAVCANFRFDAGKVHSMIKGIRVDTQRHKLGAMIGSDTKIGVNASLMPGIKINPRSRIMPNSSVTKDVI